MPSLDLSASLPEWLDVQRLQWVMLALMAVLVLVALGVVRFVQRLATMVISLGLIGGLVFALYTQRTDLQDCQATCSCRLFGQEVHVPESPLCGPERIGAAGELDADGAG